MCCFSSSSGSYLTGSLAKICKVGDWTGFGCSTFSGLKLMDFTAAEGSDTALRRMIVGFMTRADTCIIKL